MVLVYIAIILAAVLITAVIGGIAVYIDARRQGNQRGWLWSILTALGFVFGILPGIAIIVIYLIVSRQL